MSKEITKYDRELADRIEKIRAERGLTKDDMAHLMSVDIGTYKRYAYKIQKVPATAVGLLCDELQLDLTYVVYGRDTSANEFAKYLGTVDQRKLGDLFFEVSKECRARARTLEKLKDKTPPKGRKKAGEAANKAIKQD